MHRNSFFNFVEENITSCLFMQANDLIALSRRKPFYIEVGANNGVDSNKIIAFIRHHAWTGLSIEPVPQAYESLASSYKDFRDVKTLNLAIGETAGVLPFYQVVDPAQPWQTMLSSFDKNVILKQTNLIADVADHIQQIDVRSEPLSEICRTHNITDLDVLVVDAEGYDDKILYTLDWDNYLPLVVNFEHKHLPVDRLRTLDLFLVSRGYQRLILWADTAYVRGDMLKDECVQQCLRGLPNLFPKYDPDWGNGYWLDHWP